MFKRDILFHLERWKDDTHRKPLILRGARQVGKTTVVNEFGKQFDNYLYLNLEKREAASLFELNVSLKDLMPLFFAHCGKIRNKLESEGRSQKSEIGGRMSDDRRQKKYTLDLTRSFR